MSISELSRTVGEVFYTAGRDVCLPGVPQSMVSPNVTVVFEEGPHGWGCEGELGRWPWW